jgi:phosphoglycerate dehydrogenase-like enzyme
VHHPLTVLVAAIISAEQLDGLRAAFPKVRFVPLPRDGAVPPKGVEAEVLLRCAMPKDALDRAAQAAPQLRWIHTCTAGFDWVLTPTVIERKITISRSATAYAIPIAEYVLAYMLLLAKRLPQLLQAQAEARWAPPEPDELTKKTVGIVGAGAIGAEVAKRARSFGMHVIGMRRSAAPAPGADETLPPEALPELLSRSDYVVLAAPLTEATRGMIAAPQLRQMKPGAYLINIARGALTVEADLAQALREGWIAGACIDAFETEPLPPESPLWSLPNAVITPHCSYRSPNGLERALAEFGENLRRYMAGEPLWNTLGEQGY